MLNISIEAMVGRVIPPMSPLYLPRKI